MKNGRFLKKIKFHGFKISQFIVIKFGDQNWMKKKSGTPLPCANLIECFLKQNLV